LQRLGTDLGKPIDVAPKAVVAPVVMGAAQ
jgi:hypothetical protein